MNIPQLDLLKIKAWFAKWAALIVLLLATHIGAGWYGYVKGAESNTRAVVKELQKDAKEKVREGKQNASTAEKVGQESANMDARIARALEDLDEAIRKAQENPGAYGCGPSPDQLRALKAIYDSYPR